MRTACLLLLAGSIGCNHPSTTTVAKDHALKSEVSFPPPDWTHRELVDYLNRNGLKLAMTQPAIIRDAGNKLLSVFHEGADVASPSVWVYICPDPQSAKDQAASMGEGGFAAGRFAFGRIGMPGRTADDAGLLVRISTVVNAPRQK
jgi:hypothetical protein